MKRSLVVSCILTGLAVSVPQTASAQWVVHDPVNYGELVVTFNQLVREYTLLLQQTRRLPLDLAARYRVPTVPWASHDLIAEYAGGVLDALNRGVRAGDPYGELLAKLDSAKV